MKQLLESLFSIQELEDVAGERAKRTIALDFDGVIHSYTSGWTSAADIPDAPVPGAKEAIAELRGQYRVAIYSARAGQPGGKEAIEKWLADNGIEVDEISVEKPPAHVYVDDRGITFRGDWPDTLAKIKTFKSYLGESIKEATDVKEVLLRNAVSDVLLEFGDTAKEDTTTSDLQGIAIVKAVEIIKLVRDGLKEQFGWM